MLPATLPEKFTGPSAWNASDMENTQRWLYTLTPQDIADLEQAVENFVKTGQDIGTITKETFPLRTFDTYLKQLLEILIHGVGVQVLRGLHADRFDQKTLACIFCGIGAYIGSARSQNAAGHILGHVRDTGANATDTATRIYQTAERQTFHTDSADAVGLLCLAEAKQGGDSLLVSAETIYNEMRMRRPELLPLLFDPIATDRRGEVPEGMKPYMTIPPLSWHNGHLTVFYQRQYIDAAQRFDGAMRLTPKHIEALDMFDRLANDPELNIRMRLKPGDIQFVYNHGFMHDRTAFVDWKEPERRRHLLRLWLSLPGDRELPSIFAQRYGSIEVGDRGGIITARTQLHVPLD